MAVPTVKPTRQSPWQKRLIVLAAILFPLLVASGLFAPQVISVMADEEAEIEDEEAPNLDFRKPLHGMPPLPLPRDYDIGFIPELLDLQHLFSQQRYSMDSLSRQFARLSSFPRNHGDVIVLDDVDREIRDIVFKDPVMVGAIIGPIGPPDPNLLSLGSPRPLGDGLRFDDPQGLGQEPVAVIPEPRTALLLLAGLVFLARIRR